MSTTREVRPDQHGTYTGYTCGCRCDDCKRACSAHFGRAISALDCVGPHSPGNFPCQQIPARIARADSEVARLARMASKSEKSFGRYGGQLIQAKAERDTARQVRDAHMAECPSAAERWSK